MSDIHVLPCDICVISPRSRARPSAVVRAGRRSSTRSWNRPAAPEAVGQADAEARRWPDRLQRHLGSPGRHRVRAAGEEGRTDRSVSSAAAPLPPVCLRRRSRRCRPTSRNTSRSSRRRSTDFSKRQVELDSNLRCQPPGVPRIGPPTKIVQNAREVVFLYDDVNGSFFRIIPTDGRTHRTDVPASYLGDADRPHRGRHAPSSRPWASTKRRG